MAYGDTIYNITKLYVAKLNSDNSFGTPVLVDQMQKLSYEFNADTDMLKSYGLITDLLTINTHIAGTYSQASLDFPAMAILTGQTSSSSGSAPNRVETMDFTVGGAGLPYFAWVAEYAATNGARAVAGAAKNMLDKSPGFTSEQNKFRIGEVGFKAVAPSQTARIALRLRRIEGTFTTPTDSAGFATFFSGFFA